MGVGSSDAERAYASSPRQFRALPVRQRTANVERAFAEINFRVWFVEVQAGWQLPVLQREDGLDQAGNAGRRIEVANVRFDRSYPAESPFVSIGTKDLGQGGDLDWVSQGRPGSMCLNVLNGCAIDVGHR